MDTKNVFDHVDKVIIDLCEKSMEAKSIEQKCNAANALAVIITARANADLMQGDQ